MDRNCNLLFALTVFILLHRNTSLASAPNISTDEVALLALKSHISSPHNILQSNWSSSSPICNWIGITCSSRHNRVTALNISSMQLHGTIPPHLGNLSFLVSLDISNNTFHGDFPEELAHLQRLKLIDVTSNNFTGSIPSFLSFLPNLQYMYLSMNQFWGEIPSSLSNLTKLEVLRMNTNFLKGEIRREIGYLRYLTILDLQCNQLTGSIPTSIFNITTMQNIALTYNNLTGKLPSSICDHLPNLEGLYLGGNSLDGAIPPNLEKCKKLQVLVLAKNEFIGTVPRELANLTALTILRMSTLHLEGEISVELGYLKKLQVLSLAENEFTGSVPASIFNVSTLKILDLGTNKLSGQSFLSNDALCGDSRFNVKPCAIQSSKRKKAFFVLYIILIVGLPFLVLALAYVFLSLLRTKKNIGQADVSLVKGHERVSYYELEHATEGFNESNFLGNGSFTMVYKGLFKDGTLFAAKVFNIQLESAFKSFDTECEILRNLRHRNLIKVITSCSNLDFKALVLEYMPNGTLDKWLYSHNLFLDLLQRLDIMIDVASAMDYLHNGYSTPVVHCDLKPSNVLLDQEMVAHVSDFGIAKLLGAGEAFVQTRTVATIGYIAPEYGQDGIVSTSSDVYGFGILIMETFTRMRPSDEIFTGELSIQRCFSDPFPSGIHKVLDSILVSPRDDQIDVKMQCMLSIMELALSCTLVRPDARISMEDALSTLKKIRLHIVSSRY